MPYLNVIQQERRNKKHGKDTYKPYNKIVTFLFGNAEIQKDKLLKT